MAAKQLTFGTDAREQMRTGAYKAFRAVSATLGPKGRLVTIAKSFGSPKQTKDGVTVAKEIEIANDVLRQEGKPEAMLENIAKGKLGRFFKDNTLVNQDFIKDNKLSVSEYVKSVDAGLVVTGFKRVALA